MSVSNGNSANALKSQSGDNRPRTFPLPGTTYLHTMLYNPTLKKRCYTSFKLMNRIIAPFYRLRLLPVFGVGRLVLLLTTRGRKSTKLRDTPIGYFRYKNEIYLISGWGTEANSYKNILAYPDDV